MSMGSGCSALGLMPMSAPAKICQTSPALDLLENKKKVQRNSLYHWVLWREALRGEKEATARSNPNSPMPLPRSRLSFNWKVGVAWNKIRSRLPNAKHWGTALVCKMLFGGEKRRFVQKHPCPHLCQTLIQTEDKIHIYFTPSKEKMYFLYAEKTEKYIE